MFLCKQKVIKSSSSMFTLDPMLLYICSNKWEKIHCQLILILHIIFSVACLTELSSHTADTGLTPGVAILFAVVVLLTVVLIALIIIYKKRISVNGDSENKADESKVSSIIILMINKYPSNMTNVSKLLPSPLPNSQLYLFFIWYCL